MSKKILKKVANGKLSPNEAYLLLYGPKPRAGRFVSLRIKIKDHKWVSRFVNALFFFPIPIALGKPFIIKALKKEELDPKKMYEIIRKYSGGLKLIVKSAEAKVKISII